jgi:hypothetical protein
MLAGVHGLRLNNNVRRHFEHPTIHEMNKSLQREVRYLLPAWIICVLLPLPLILFWHSSKGRSYALMCFSVGCAILSAYSLRRDIRPPNSSAASDDSRPQTWRERMWPLGLALFAASAAFSTFSLVISDSRDFVTPMLAFMVLVPALGIVPYMVLATRNPLAGVIFSIILVGSLKTPIGAMIVHTFFPSHFQQSIDTDGSLIMPTPWIHPNLLVWFLYSSVAAFSLLFYYLGARRFRGVYDHDA